MANFLDKFKITTGLDTNTSLDLTCDHITTGDWMCSSPVYIKEMVPGETLKVHQETFTRMASLVVPTYGRCMIHNRAFFVPMRTLFKQWDEFITNATSDVFTNNASTVGNNSVVQISKVPTIKNSEFVSFFCTANSNSVPITSNIVSNNLANKQQVSSSVNYHEEQYDIIVCDKSSGGLDYGFNLTNQGRRVMKILNSLGYAPIWQCQSSATGTDIVDVEYSALPLLAWFRIMLDWYYATAYVGDADYNYVKSILDSYVVSGTDCISITASMLKGIFGAANNVFSGLVNYDSDYFVSAFDYPNNSNVAGLNASGEFTIMDQNFVAGTSNDNNVPRSMVSNYSGNTIAAVGNVPLLATAGTTASNNFPRVTQFGLDALKALTDYAKRHQLVGARALDRFYARFGKSLSAAKMDRSVYIGGDNIPLEFSDVMAHADSTGVYLGDYAGKGIGYGSNGNYEYSTDEYGFFVVISSIVPKVGYYQGVDRMVLHRGKLDFWTPEFDQLGNQAIAALEYYSPMNAKFDNGANNTSDFVDKSYPGSIFGWTPRYAEYKVGRDKLTGDYRYGSKSMAGTTSNSWYLWRNVGYSVQDAQDVVHGMDKVNGYDAKQYNRVFNAITGDSDPFYMIHHFDVLSQSPMHSLYDTYKFENEDEGAKKVVADVNGVKVN